MKRQSQCKAEASVSQRLFFQPLCRGKYQRKLRKVVRPVPLRRVRLPRFPGARSPDKDQNSAPAECPSFSQTARSFGPAYLAASGVISPQFSIPPEEHPAVRTIISLEINSFVSSTRKYIMTACSQVGTSHHSGNSLDIAGYDQVDQRFPAFRPGRIFRETFTDTRQCMVVSMILPSDVTEHVASCVHL